MSEIAASPRPMALSRGERAALTFMHVLFGICERMAPHWGAAWAERLFTTPRRHTPPEFEREMAESGEPLEFSFEGLTLRALAWGTGPVVLLVHGWEGRGAQLGRFAGPLLSAGYRVVALDGPAHGASEGKRTEVARMARALVEVGRQLGPLHGVIAHSFGGAATLIAAGRGLAVGRIVAIGVPDALMSVIGRFQQVVRLPPRIYELFLRRLERRMGTAPESMDTALAASELEVPCLLIHDRGDTEVPFLEGERIHQCWPAARFHPTEGLGHRRILKDQHVIVETARFLTEAP